MTSSSSISAPFPSTTTSSSQYSNALAFFKFVVALVIFYGMGMVLAGRAFAVQLFDTLGFGPHSHGLEDAACVDFSIFAFGILGAVIVGWMVLLWFVVDLMDSTTEYRVRAAARRMMAASIASWFVLDTGFSMALSEWNHAAFNLPFVTLLSVPLFIMNAADTEDPNKTK